MRAAAVAPSAGDLVAGVSGAERGNAVAVSRGCRERGCGPGLQLPQGTVAARALQNISICGCKTLALGTVLSS